MGDMGEAAATCGGGMVGTVGMGDMGEAAATCGGGMVGTVGMGDMGEAAATCGGGMVGTVGMGDIGEAAAKCGGGIVGTVGIGDIGEADAIPGKVNNIEANRPRRIFCEVIVILDGSLWVELCTKMVPHKLQGIYNKSNFFDRSRPKFPFFPQNVGFFPHFTVDF
jgi:hypothetical protein